MFKKVKAVHFLAGMASAAMAAPFGIIAAALTPVAIGFAKEIYMHFTGKASDLSHFAWLIAGAATFLLCLKLAPVRL